MFVSPIRIVPLEAVADTVGVVVGPVAVDVIVRVAVAVGKMPVRVGVNVKVGKGVLVGETASVGPDVTAGRGVSVGAGWQTGGGLEEISSAPTRASSSASVMRGMPRKSTIMAFESSPFAMLPK